MERYDTIVVGAGMGGLICGNFLARGGKRVLMLEQNHQPGGLMGGFWRKGFYFDAGDQSIESMGITFPILKLLGLYDPKEWERAMYRFIVGGVDHTITDFKGTGEALAKVFPNGADGIRRSFAKLEEISGFLGAVSDKGRFPYTARGMEQVIGLFRMLAVALKNPSLAREIMSRQDQRDAGALHHRPRRAGFRLGPGLLGDEHPHRGGILAHVDQRLLVSPERYPEPHG